MNITKLISRLDINQRVALKKILDKLQAKKSLSGKDVGLLGLKIEHCQQVFVLEVFGITKPTIAKWEDDGCPRNEDGSYNIKIVAEWRVKYEKEKYVNKNDPNEKNSHEAEKIKLQCEKLQIEINESKKNTVPISEVKANLTEIMTVFKSYFTEYGRMNLHLIANKPVEELRKYWDELVRSGLNEFVKANKAE
jgi:phage terminase Nu1 subunit (DNA packaging protein)